MNNRIFSQIHFAVLVFAFLSLCGFSDVSIKDVETAIISQDYEQAKQIATQLLSDESISDQHSEIQYYVGLCDLRLGRYRQAQEIFTELSKTKNDDNLRDKAYLGIFDTYYISGEYARALQSVNRLLKISPKSEFLSLIYLKFARANLKLAHWYEARGYLKKIVTDFPNSMEVHVAKQLLNEKLYFAVQVGAFIDRQRAEKLTDELQEKGEYAYVIETVDQKNRTFYRVRVGQLVLLKKAEKLKLKLSKEGYPTQIYP